MNIKIKREQLLPALISTSSVVEKRQTLPILSNLLLKQKEGILSITGSNLEVEVNKTLSGLGSDEIEITLAANKLVEICRALPVGSSININIEPGKAILTSGKSRFTLKSLPANEFPDVVFNGCPGRTLLPKWYFAGSRK